jgi:hypothetical protein
VVPICRIAMSLKSAEALMRREGGGRKRKRMNGLKQQAIAHSSNSASRLSLGRIPPKTTRSFRDRNGTGLCMRIHRA